MTGLTMEQQIEAVRDDRTLPTGYYKAILISLISQPETPKISQKEIMKNAGVGSRNTLISNLQQLETLGWLKVYRDRDEENRFTENTYEVIIPNARLWHND